MAVYDSAKVRRVAVLMTRLAGSMEADVQSVLRAAADPLDGLRAKTAQAMENRLEALVRTSGGLQEELYTFARQIRAYADALEETDEQLARKL